MPAHFSSVTKASYPLMVLLLFSGCATDTQRDPRVPKGTVPFQVKIETSEPLSKIEVNGEYVGDSPLTITIWGNKDGTFFGDGYTEIRANPIRPGQYVQTKRFANGRKQKTTFADRLAGAAAGYEDPTYAARMRAAEQEHPHPLGARIPSRIHFDLDLVPVVIP
ncbi:MAG: hypothetical protein HS113_18390 [Verrucomicrobiales bacterium]|nr:hypothetical protein [Verrucomicrobiales bacterium]